MKLKEDLIIIDAEKAKDKLYELKAEIEKAEGNLKAFLCDLFDIYMFQVFSSGMPRSSDEAKEVEEKGKDEMIHSDLTKKEWDELQAWRKEIKAEFNESLTEGLSYYEQEQKMDAWHRGTRKQNVGACSDSKLKMNYDICVRKGYVLEANQLFNEAKKRGLWWAQPQPAQQAQPQPQKVTLTIELGLDDFHTADGFFVRDAADTSEIIKNSMAATGTIRHLLISLIWALCLQKPSGFIQALKLYLVNNCNYSEDQIKETINKCLNNPDIITRLNQGTKDIKNA